MLVHLQTYWAQQIRGHCIARLYRQAGILGYRTNHSLCATAATRLYQSGIVEQLVMEKTNIEAWMVSEATNTSNRG
jgi:hypothetical protein